MPLHVPRGERTARRLGEELEALARALQRAGAQGPAAARLLELASVAAMHAVGLDHALAPPPPPAGAPSATPVELSRPAAEPAAASRAA